MEELKNNGIELIEITTPKNGNRFGIFKCHCSKKFECRISYIKTGHTKSCGCKNKKYLRGSRVVGDNYADYYLKQYD